MINELGIEDYLRGLGETSEVSHPEFKKALITVARTYALYQWERATKHKSEYFHMNAYADDQVYRGYGYEINNQSIGRAVDETRGLTVNYQGRTAITPYFSRSDGRTRDWGEVWHGTVDWIKSVPAPCDAERKYKLWGHGVGMSATEALCMADRGKKWEDIVHYFYQGVDMKKRWE
jgi:stage II sporulation protein D